MNKLAKREKPGPKPKPPIDLQKLDSVQVVAPELSPEQAFETLLIFDARCLDRETQQELLLLLPALIHIRRAWKAHYSEYGCVCCHKKTPKIRGTPLAVSVSRARVASSSECKNALES